MNQWLFTFWWHIKLVRCLTRQNLQPRRLHGLHHLPCVGVLGHANVLSCVLQSDVGQMQRVHLGSVALQGLHVAEIILTFDVFSVGRMGSNTYGISPHRVQQSRRLYPSSVLTVSARRRGGPPGVCPGTLSSIFNHCTLVDTGRWTLQTSLA